MASLDRYSIIYSVKLAQQAERYNDMVDGMKKLTEFKVDLTPEERTLLCIAYRNVVTSPRDSLRILAITEQEENKKRNNVNVNHTRLYRQNVESKLTNICNDAIELVDNLLPFASSSESSVFYLKMKADYYRYLAEIKFDDEKKEAIDQSLNAYKDGLAIAVAELLPSHPARLGLALNFAVFYYEIMNSSDRAISIAREAVLEAVDTLKKASDKLDENSRRIIGMLRENVTLWTGDNSVADD